jgi:hypothetical protein
MLPDLVDGGVDCSFVIIILLEEECWGRAIGLIIHLTISLIEERCDSDFHVRIESSE